MLGTQRSGSNLLRLMLNQLPGVIAPHPPHILHTFYPLLTAYEPLLRPENFRRLIEDVCTLVDLNPVPWNHKDLDRDKIVSGCRQNTLLEIFRNIYEQEAEKSGASTWCCKSMSNVYYVKELEKAGLNPIYIHLFRDGRDVALSFKNTLVGPKHIYFLAKKWQKEQEMSLAWINEIGPERGISISYEQLIHEPERIMKAICKHINQPYTDKVLDYYHSNESSKTAESGKMWHNLAKPIISDNEGKYKEGLTKEDIFLFEHIAGDTLQLLGYQVENHITTPLIMSESRIKEFQKENEQLIQLAVSRADANDLLKRAPQQNHIQSVKSQIKI